MAIIKNTNFVIDGVTYVMNQNQIVMGSDVIVLCSRADGIGNLKVAKFVVNSEDETASYLELLPDISMSYVNSDNSYWENGCVLLKLSETSAYILVHSSGDDSSGQNTIWQLSKSGSVYSTAFIQQTLYDSSDPPTSIPRINIEVCFGVVSGTSYIYYTGYDWGLETNKIYAYDPLSDTLVTHTLSSDFYNGGYEKSAILAWRDRIWITNGSGDVAGILVDSVNAFGVGDDVFIESDSGIESTPVTNLVTPFGDSELWASCGDYESQLSTQFVIKYNDETGSYYKTTYSVNCLNFELSSDMSYFGQFHHQRLYGYIQISDTQTYVISTNHASRPNYSVYIYKCVKDDANEVLNTTCLMRISNPNVPVELFSSNGNNYIVFGYGRTGNGTDVSIYRIDETLPPKIWMLSSDVSAKVGDSVTLNGICLFDGETASIDDINLVKNGSEIVQYVSSSIVPSAPTFSCSLDISDTSEGVYSFVGTVVGGNMDSVEVMSNTMNVSTIDGTIGHIGAFYFGGDFTNAIIDTYTVPVLNINSVDYVSNASITHNIPLMEIVVPKETSEVVVEDPFSFDFSAAPRSGVVPLATTFHIYNYEPKDNFDDVWEAFEFCWWFGDGTTVTTSADTIDHVYCGFGGSDGKYFDVSASVHYRLKE